MEDYQHDNPYASPQAAIEASPSPEPEMGQIWREGDELVFIRKQARPPRACWVTNRERFLHQAPLVDDAVGAAVVLGLLLIPIVGFILALFVAVVATILGHIGGAPSLAWLTWGLAFKRAMVALTVGFLFIAAFATSNISVAGGSPLFLVAVVIGALAIYLYVTRDRLVLGLEARRDGRRLVRVRGVHPDYLARLPERPSGA